MATLNTRVQLSPSQGQLEEALPGSGSLEAADKEAADLLNSAIRKKKVEETPQKVYRLFGGIPSLVGVSSLFHRSTKTPTLEPGGEGEIGEGEHNGREAISESPRSEDATSKGPAPPVSTARKSATPKSIPGTAILPEGNIKRKRPDARPGVYEGPGSSENPANESEELAGRQPVRARMNTRSKKPIIPPKTSKGASVASSRPTRAAQVESGATELAAPTKPTTSSRMEIAIPPVSDQTKPAKAKRGRPPQKKRPQAATSEYNVPEVPPSDRDVNRAVDGSPAAVLYATDGGTNQASLDSGEGVSDILDDPSPVKVAQLDTRQVTPAANRMQLRSRSGNFEAGDRPKGSSIDGDISGIEDLENHARVRVDQDARSSESGDMIYEIDDLDKMLTRSERVGCTFNEKEGWSRRRTETTPKTQRGKNMVEGLVDLGSRYKGLKIAKVSGNGDPALIKTQANITRIIEVLQLETEQVLTTMLGNPSTRIGDFEEDPTIRMVTDLYFNVLPSFIGTIKAGAEAHSLKSSMETSALQEIYDLVDMLSRLAETALRQPTQPVSLSKASKRRTYQFSQPTKSIITEIRNLHSKLLSELKNRERAEKRKEYERMRSERERKRRQQAQQEQTEKRRRAREIHKIQSQNLAEQLADPFWGDILMAEIMKEEAKGTVISAASTVSKPRTRKYRVANSRSREIQYISDQDVDDDPFADNEDDPFADEHDGYQRVSVFENNNTRRQSGPRPWSNGEKTKFIDFIRYEQGEDRYERLAQLLERSMDEIFSSAKDLQEAMDYAHERGMMNEEGDEWTYDIWVDPKQRD